MDNDSPAPNPPATNNVEAYLAMLAGVEGLPMPATIDNNAIMLIFTSSLFISRLLT